jgi:hypothetical protein
VQAHSLETIADRVSALLEDVIGRHRTSTHIES